MAEPSPQSESAGARVYRTHRAWTAFIYASVAALLLMGLLGWLAFELPAWTVAVYVVMSVGLGLVAAPQSLAKLSLSDRGLAYWMKWGHKTSWVFRWKDVEAWSIATEAELNIALGRRRLKKKSRAGRRAEREFFEAQEVTAKGTRRYLLFRVQGIDRIFRLDPSIVTLRQFEEVAAWFRRHVGEPRLGKEQLHLRIDKPARDLHQYKIRPLVRRRSEVHPEAGTPADTSHRIEIEETGRLRKKS